MPAVAVAAVAGGVYGSAIIAGQLVLGFSFQAAASSLLVSAVHTSKPLPCQS